MSDTKPKFYNVQRWADYNGLHCVRINMHHYVVDAILDVYPRDGKYKIAGDAERKPYDCLDDLLDVLRYR